MNRFDHTAAAILRRDINEALKTVADKHGISVEIDGNIGFDASSLRARIQCAVKTPTGEIFNQSHVDWKNHGNLFGFVPEDLGKIVIIKNDRFRIDGLAPNRPKNCVHLKRVHDNKAFKCPPETVRRQLVAQRAHPTKIVVGA